MRILHISDTHGMFPEPQGAFDLVVHSGDMIPNRSYGNRQSEEVFQAHWIEENASKFHPRYREVPFLFISGNHDYIDPTLQLRVAGIEAHCIDMRPHIQDGVGFYGFPWTNRFYDWNWMCSEMEMEEHLNPLSTFLAAGMIDVLVSHGPMFGVLDHNAQGERCGSRALRHRVKDAKHPPKLVLHGHIHESPGYIGWTREIRVSNAACMQRIVTI